MKAESASLRQCRISGAGGGIFMHRLLKRFCNNEGGNFAIIFGLVLVPIAASIGAGVDYSQMYSRKSKMQSAADTAVLAAAQDARNASHFAHLADAYLAANLPDIKLETTPKTGPNSVELTIVNNFQTSFLGIVGVPEVKITVNTELAIEKFGRGSTNKATGSNNPTGSQIRTMVRELERQRDAMLKSASGLPPRERDKIRRQISRKFAHLIDMATAGKPVSQIYLKK